MTISDFTSVCPSMRAYVTLQCFITLRAPGASSVWCHSNGYLLCSYNTNYNDWYFLLCFKILVLSFGKQFQFLELLPPNMEYIAMLTIIMDMNDVIAEEAVEDAISTGKSIF